MRSHIGNTFDARLRGDRFTNFFLLASRHDSPTERGIAIRRGRLPTARRRNGRAEAARTEGYCSAMADPVLYDVADRIATITLNRPHRRNAWTGAMHAAYRVALDHAERDTAVRAIIVTGAESADGRSAFCVGGDSEALAGYVEKGAYDSGLRTTPVMPGAGTDPRFEADFAYHFALTKPVVAAINGPAAGVGLAVACFADVRIAVPGAKLTTAHGRIGLPAEYGLSWLLPRLIGQAPATELLFSSRAFLTDEAYNLRLIHQLVAPDELLEHTRSWTQDLIANNAPTSLAATKQQLYLDMHRDVRASVEHAQELLDELATTDEYAHGIRSLLHKEPPRFDQR